MKQREEMVCLLTWQIGDCTTCKAFGQPWFRGALQFQPIDEVKKRMKVCDLVDEQTGTWDAQLLINLFGYQNYISIVANLQPPVPTRGRDRLIFSKTANGAFAVRQCYYHIQAKRLPVLGPVLKATGRQFGVDIRVSAYAPLDTSAQGNTDYCISFSF